MKTFKGTVLFLDRDDINTDEIIPAKHLAKIDKQQLGPHILEDLSFPGFNPATDIAGYSTVITRANFGCGSSREHAVWVFEVNDINVVIASSFARIFRQNMANCGMLAIELSEEVIDELFQNYSGQEATVDVDFEAGSFLISGSGEEVRVTFAMNEFDKEVIQSGGWINYVEKNF